MMNKFIMKNFWIIKKSEEYKHMPKKFKKDFPELKENDIQSNLDSLLFIELKERNDSEILEGHVQYSVRLNVKRDYMKQLLNERGIYRHKNKKTGERVWVQRSLAKSEPIEATMEDEVYRKKREDVELREYVNSNLTEKEQKQLRAIETAENGGEMAELMGVSDDYARKIKERLHRKIKKILTEFREDEVA